MVNSLVPNCQSTFISQMHIQDELLVTNEVMDYAKRFNKDCLVVKIVFQQAYDYICWKYLRHVMKSMHFGNKWM